MQASLQTIVGEFFIGVMKMEVTAKKNIFYKGEIYLVGEKFECEEAEELKKRGLIESAEMKLPSLEEEIKRKKR